MKPFLIVFLSIICNWTLAQNLQPTETKAVLNITVTDFDGKPRAGETISMVSQKTKAAFPAKTDASGKCAVLLPEGDTYDINYREFIQDVNYSSIEIPTEIGAMTYDLVIKFEPEKVFVLEDVFFDVGKSSIKPESNKALDELFGWLKSDPKVVIEIAGHTDNDGDNISNMTLSQERADNVRKYLLKKGIDPKRVSAKGYGETQPVANNDTPDGRQQNRRTEVRIMSE